MPVVTIRGQLGSGAPQIGQLIAEKLDADYVDRQIIARMAVLLERDKRDIAAKEMPPGSLFGRIAAALGRGYLFGVDYRGVYMPAWEIPLDDTRYLEVLTSVITELADRRATVIQGRGSQFILKNQPKALHILLVASLELRIKRTMNEMKVDEETATKEIERYDSSRREFIKRYFNAELENPIHYDLVINTEHLSFEATTSVVIDALVARNQTTVERAMTSSVQS
jgi:cytidylate kinase